MLALDFEATGVLFEKSEMDEEVPRRLREVLLN